MSKYSYLSGYKINLCTLQEKANNDLLEVLQKVNGTKAIVWDLEISETILNLMIDSSLLQQYREVKRIPLKPGPLPCLDVENIIFITRPRVEMIDFITENLIIENTEQTGEVHKKYYLYFLPNRSEFCEKKLIDKGVHKKFTTIGHFNWIFFPLDKDLISMERKSDYFEIFLEEDPTCLKDAALGLIKLQKLYGRIPKVYGKGIYAERIWEYAKTIMRAEKHMFKEKSPIDQMIMLDRSIDIMSVLATQLTYEGLIDENYGINHGHAYFPAEKFLRHSEERFPTLNANEIKKIFLNSGEVLFSKLRDKHFNEIGTILSKQAKDMSKELEERHNEISVQKMKMLVEKLPEIMEKKKSIATHTTVAELIKEITNSPAFLEDLAIEQDFMCCLNLERVNSYIEELINKKADILKIIRLISMQNIASSGLKPKIMDFYKREIVHVYGIHTLSTLRTLEKAGLLKPQSDCRCYSTLRKTLNLTVDEVKEISPKDISYVHSFYAPLTVRIVERMLKINSWQTVKNILNVIPCPTFEDFQAPLIGQGGIPAHTRDKRELDASRVILVFFVGGCTYAEISALRFLSKQDDVEFLILTTKIINKNSFLKNFF